MMPPKQLNIIQRDSFYFSTNKRNLLTILSAGHLAPAIASYRYVNDTRELANGRILLWAGGVPGELISTDSVIIEVDSEFIDFALKHAPDGAIASATYLVTSVPVPIALMRNFLFSDKAAMDDFLLRLFDDIPVDLQKFGTFAGLVRLPTEAVRIPVSSQSDVDMMGFDKKCGAVLAAIHLNCMSAEAFKIIASLCNGHMPDSGVVLNALVKEGGPDASGKSDSVDQWMLNKVLSILSHISPDNGFDQRDFLGQLTHAATRERADISKSVNTWAAYVTRMINGETDVHRLDDYGSVVQRGILLFLLRPTIPRIAASGNSLLRPGPRVLAVGTFLSGFYTGATRLPGEYKRDFGWYSQVMSALLQDWLSAPLPLSTIKLEFRQIDNTQVKALMFIADTIVTEHWIEPNPILHKVMRDAKSINCDLTYDFSADELSYEFEFEVGKKQTVFILCIKSTSSGKDVIRFTSPCLRLSSKAKFLKDDALDLLKRNDEIDMHCCFAISQLRNSVVVQADRIVETMNEKELFSQMESVARAAYDYNLEKTKS